MVAYGEETQLVVTIRGRDGASIDLQTMGEVFSDVAIPYGVLDFTFTADGRGGAEELTAVFPNEANVESIIDDIRRIGLDVYRVVQKG